MQQFFKGLKFQDSTSDAFSNFNNMKNKLTGFCSKAYNKMKGKTKLKFAGGSPFSGNKVDFEKDLSIQKPHL
jgi:hypothetical protein